MQNKLIIGGIIVVVLAGIVTYIIFSFGGGSAVNGGSLSQEQNMSQVSGGALSSSTPQGDTILIGTPSGNVRIKNFYKNALGVVEGSEVVIVQNQNYKIDYSTSDSSFAVAVASGAPAGTQHVAENDILNILGTTPADACKLSITVFSSGGASRPSFCE